METQHTKQQIRAHMLSVLKRRNPVRKLHDDLLLTQKLIEHPRYQEANTVAVFMSMDFEFILWELSAML
ncbi:5-formyltetrahydrofolate cyclo-ligase [Alloscardovia venturai]|uniref:5-formyltetrahydrofolate cyclo-ligase n=1 Tax=Alloscardovia venturai TaxID=1769421 RepID=UPI003671FBB6